MLHIIGKPSRALQNRDAASRTCGAPEVQGGIYLFSPGSTTQPR